MEARWKDKLWDVVQDAVLAGTQPKEFLVEVRECWRYALQDEIKDSDTVWKKAIEESQS